MKKNFTVGELAEVITNGNERIVRIMLNDTGAVDPKLDENITNPNEIVSRSAIIDLVALRAGDIVGRRAARLLS